MYTCVIRPIQSTANRLKLAKLKRKSFLSLFLSSANPIAVWCILWSKKMLIWLHSVLMGNDFLLLLPSIVWPDGNWWPPSITTSQCISYFHLIMKFFHLCRLIKPNKGLFWLPFCVYISHLVFSPNLVCSLKFQYFDSWWKKFNVC